MPKPAYHHGNLSQQAHQLALDILREQGDTAISLRALARQIGVSGPALYRHFADRESLLADLAIDGFQQLRERLRAETDDAQAPRPTLIRIGQAYIDFAQAEPNLYRLMFGGRILPKGQHPRLDQAGREAFQVLSDTVARGQQAGELKQAPLSMLTASAWSLVHGFALLAIDGHLPDQHLEPQLAEGVITLLLEGAHVTSPTPEVLS